MLMRFFLGACTAGILLSATPKLAMALPSHTFVADYGADSGACTQSTPCASFSYAFGQTAAGGEIDALTGGDYGQLTISHAITISGSGTNSAIAVPVSEVGITVNAGSADSVVLRKLAFNGGPSGTSQALYGVDYQAGGSLAINGCDFNGFFNQDIRCQVTATGDLAVRDSVFSGGGFGLLIPNTSSSAVVSLENVSFQHVYTCIDTESPTADVDISNSQLTQSRSIAIYANASTVNVQNCTISNNPVAIEADANSHIRINDDNFFDNNSLLDIVGNGSIVSSGNNHGIGSGFTSPPTGVLHSI